MNGLRVLREVSGIEDYVLASLLKEKDPNGTPFVLEYEDGSQWVDNDRPWDTEIARALVRHVGRFAVADEQNGIVAGPYRALDKAELARKSAKVTVSAFVEDVPEDEPSPEIEPLKEPPNE